jgi:hypothetical protein
MKLNNKIVAILMAIAILLSGCSPAFTKKSIEKELVSFILDFIIQQDIRGPANYIQTSGQPWVDVPTNAKIIIWAHPVEKIDENTTNYLKDDEPIKVWLYADNKLAEMADKLGTIKDYQMTHNISNSETDTASWGYYDFGILSISDNNNEAKVYVGFLCGPVCGESDIYTLERNDSGKWEIKDSEFLWMY